ncbi:hypothetical protein GQ53DRAFT_818746 [Thozetella sp. PMI_491]|nr:hypothetical protein GQ53DRAFT_818746 [Thozetella sp. PMI_491]
MTIHVTTTTTVITTAAVTTTFTPPDTFKAVVSGGTSSGNLMNGHYEGGGDVCFAMASSVDSTPSETSCPACSTSHCQSKYIMQPTFAKVLIAALAVVRSSSALDLMLFQDNFCSIGEVDIGVAAGCNRGFGNTIHSLSSQSNVSIQLFEDSDCQVLCPNFSDVIVSGACEQIPASCKFGSFSATEL